MAEGITSEQAAGLLKSDLRNLTERLKDGKPLAASERALLQSIALGGKGAALTFAGNQEELAQALGCSRKTIQRARKRPGAPAPRPDGRWDVNAWREFIRLTGRAIEDEEIEGVDHTRERARNLLLKNEKLEAEIAILRKAWMPVSEAKRLGGELGSAIRTVVARIHLCAPSVVGLSVAEAEAHLKDLEDEILAQLNTLDRGLAEYQVVEAQVEAAGGGPDGEEVDPDEPTT